MNRLSSKIWSIGLLLFVINGTLLAQSIKKTSKYQEQVSFSNYKLPNGPKYGADWLKKNKFINTFDFAISTSLPLNDLNNLSSRRNIKLNYEIAILPSVQGKNKLTPYVGIGFENFNSKNEFKLTNKTYFVTGLQYNLPSHFFLNISIPYDLAEFHWGQNIYKLNTQEYQMVNNYKLKTVSTSPTGSKLGQMRIGVGVRFITQPGFEGI